MPVLKAGLIGAHISRTRLPAALDLLCAEHGWSLDFKLIDTADLPQFDFDAQMHTAQDEGWSGMTVTHPWKTDARRFVGEAMGAEAVHLGACNTVTFAPDLRGHNTDYTGFLAAFRAFDHVPGRVVLMGAGGVAEALAPALMALGADDVAICDINAPRAAALAQSCGGRVIAPDAAEDTLRAANGLVNATPLGMAEYPGTAFDPALLGPQGWAFDAVYTPTRTMFLRDAAAAGLACLSGFALFRAMAVRSFAAYTGIDPDEEAMRPLLDTLHPD
ncbi:shikimate dehydrogenase [Aliishimia ponticola]|uniref:Shikimate dehydrogenase n=1 Tax=Aliishimia ponticola TaxID=2499833 RepID=A0A4S4N9Q4_9RHOB|nr:shikimate dehydrogenase [Aliishimia ponticola]THH35919.1 shikimate dehydrogenase [Aliishimia ponticola]